MTGQFAFCAKPQFQGFFHNEKKKKEEHFKGRDEKQRVGSRLFSSIQDQGASRLREQPLRAALPLEHPHRHLITPY